MWLNKAHGYISKYADVTPCRKWDKWLNQNETPFPCVCTSRNDECIYIEIYYKILHSYNLMKLEGTFKAALEEYRKIAHNKKAIIAWAKHHEELGAKASLFKTVIKVKTSGNPYTTVDVVLPTNEAPFLMEFRRILTEICYSDEYENY